MMGGNILPKYYPPNGANGNIQPTLGEDPYYTNKVAEWNVFLDPLGTQYVFECGLPLTLVALNATGKVPIDELFVKELVAIPNPHAQFLTKVLTSKTIKEGIGHYLDFWDPLAACVLVNPKLVEIKNFTIRVELELNEEEDTSGELIVDPQGNSIDVTIDADKKEVFKNYLDIIALP